MGTVVAVLEDVELQPGQTAPPLKARFLYDPYGQAHVEYGPELRSVKHDAARTTVDAVDQAAMDEGPAENPVIGIAGALVVTTSIGLDPESLAGGLSLEKDGVPLDAALAATEVSGTALAVMPVEGWLEGSSYKLHLTGQLTDEYGRAFVPPEGGDEKVVPINLPADVVTTTEALPNLPPDVPVVFDSRVASAAQLDCRATPDDDFEPCFPGGVNVLFQGLWTDPVTGIAYARNRWYDPRTASWLSEDPKGDVDSPNLYAFVGWGPHMGTDPMGLAGYFFDGSTNDRNNLTRTATNVAALYAMYGDTKFYRHGVGAVDEVASGMLTGAGAQKRLDWMFARFEEQYDEGQGDTNIDIFGYSRGAAMAREFANMIQEKYPEAEIRFLGIFDTVAQFGVPDVFNMNEGIRLEIPEKVEFTAHAVAVNEYRTVFPLTSIVDDYGGFQLFPIGPRRYSADEILEARGDNFWEKPFAGSHGDIGGNEGRNYDALLWMYEQAWGQGVPLNWSRREFQTQRERFKGDEEVEDTRMPLIDKIPGTDVGTNDRIVFPGNLNR